MFMRMLHLGVVVVPFFISGCGGGAPPPEMSPASPQSLVARAPSPQEIDSSPVSAPESVVMVARIANGDALARRATEWTHLPVSMAAMFGSERVADVIDFAQPLDIVVGVETHARSKGTPKPEMVGSAAIRSLVEAKAILAQNSELVPGENGVVALIPKTKDGEGDESKRCAISPAIGPSPYRFVCADKTASLDKYLPYIVRGVARMPLSSDVHVEARGAPLRGLIADLRSEAKRNLVSALAGSAAAENLFAAYDPFLFALDMGRVTLDAKLDDGGATVTLGAAFHDTQSVWTRAIASHPELAETAPTTFLRLPGESDAAFYWHGVEDVDLEEMRRSAPALAIAAMQMGGLDKTDASALGEVLRELLRSASGPLVYAKGLDAAKARAAVAAYRKADGEAAKKRARLLAIQRVAGWEIFGAEQPIAKVAAVLKGFAAAWARPGVEKWQRGTPGGESATFKFASKPAGLPKGVLHFVAADAPPPEARGGASRKDGPTEALHILIVPDGGRTWLVDALDLDLAVTKAKGLLMSTRSSETLAEREGLEVVRSSRANAGGFYGARGVALGIPISWVDGPHAQLDDDSLDALLAPVRIDALVPILVTEAVPEKGDAAALTVTTRVPRDTIAQLAR